MIKIFITESSGYENVIGSFNNWKEAYETMNEKDLLEQDALELAILDRNENHINGNYSSFVNVVDNIYGLTTDGIKNRELYDEVYGDYEIDEEDYEKAVRGFYWGINDSTLNINDDSFDEDDILMKYEDNKDFDLYYIEDETTLYDVISTFNGDDIEQINGSVELYSFPNFIRISKPEDNEDNHEYYVEIFNINNTTTKYELEQFIDYGTGIENTYYIINHD